MSEKILTPETSESIPVIAVTAAVGAIVLLFVLLCGIGRKTEEKKEDDQSENIPNGKKATTKLKQQAKNVRPGSKRKEVKHVFTHEWLATTLKSHSGTILGLDFSPNGKYLVSCGEDKTVFLWSTKQFNQKEHKVIRGNVELDYATKVRFSPDNKAFITSLFRENSVRIFRISKKDDGANTIQSAFDFPEREEDEILNVGISSSVHGKFIMTCSKHNTTMKIWDIKGELLFTINTNQMNMLYGASSPCGRFVASSGFTPDVKVWEVGFDKSGNFREVTRAFELKGHTAGVYWFSFSCGSTRMATVSKDGTWKVWNTDIEYQKQQDPKLLTTGTYDHNGPSIIAISPDGRTVAIASGSDINMYSAITGDLEQSFEDVHASPITALEFDISSKYLVSTGDKHIQVFHNVPGYKLTIGDLKSKLRTAQNSAHKQRLLEQIEEAKQALIDLGESI